MSRYSKFAPSLEQHIAGSAAGSLLAQAQRLARLNAIFMDSVPQHLGAASRVANFKSGCVVIHADNGAVATKLRQLAPRLGQAFSEKGIECNEVSIKVQAVEPAAPVLRHSPTPLPLQARLSLQELASSLPDSSTLRGALLHLVSRAVSPPVEADVMEQRSTGGERRQGTSQ